MKFTSCSGCKFFNVESGKYPCNDCKHHIGINEYFSPKQPTTPPMPPVIPPKNSDEINHPQRYAGGKYECIDVMTDVFGVDAVRNFCKLNAFKYIWREQNKNGVEDIKKAVWYLNKLIELSENANENV